MGSGNSTEQQQQLNSANSRASKAEEKVKAFEKLETEEVLSDPWRKTAKSGWNAEELLQLKKEVMAYTFPESTNIDFFNILLVGQISAGKSSILNTIESALKGDKEVTNKASAGTANKSKSLTKQLRSYKIRAKTEVEEEKLINVQFWDTMGLEVEEAGLDIQKICLILDGKVKEKSILEGTLDERAMRTKSEIKHKMHCLIFAVHAEKFAAIDENILEKLNKIRYAAMKRDIPCLIICTAVDKVCEHVKKDTSKVFYSQRILDMLTMVSEKSGFPLNMIHPLRNYVEQTMTDEHIDFLTVLTFKQIIKVSKDFCERLMDEEEEDD